MKRLILRTALVLGVAIGASGCRGIFRAENWGVHKRGIHRESLDRNRTLFYTPSHRLRLRRR